MAQQAGANRLAPALLPCRAEVLLMHAAAMTQCLENCAACERVCMETLAAVLGRPDQHVDARLIRLLADCGDICGTSARFLMRQSELHTSTCRACADVCAACATTCEA